MSELEDRLARRMAAHGIPRPEREYKFLKDRLFRFDFAWPDKKIAVEVEGGVWNHGRHTRGEGFERDCEKYNLAVVNGWWVLRFTSGMIDDGSAIKILCQEIFMINGDGVENHV